LFSAAKEAGLYTLLDGAALASTAPISLTSSHGVNESLDGKVDALAISFYKLFGYPTGVGALIARKDFLKKLKRPWFSGGTVDVVGIPCGVTESAVDWERFEEGTTNYTSLMAIPPGLELLQRFIQRPGSLLPRRLGTLHSWLHHSLQGMRHGNGTPVVTMLTADPMEICRVEGHSRSNGYVLSVTFHHPSGEQIPNSEVSRHASASGISLRTGCVCNPGGAAGLLSLRGKWHIVQEAMANSSENRVVRFQDVERLLGWEVGVVRISLGLASNFRDVWTVAKFASTLIQA
jgi:molybdenum cofactor sulfurtransferase